MVVIPKKDRDHILPQSYHPISILNIDYKILMSIWAACMNPIAATYIHPVQSEFIQNRILKDNLQRICNIINILGKTQVPALFIVDGKKAFD